MSAEELYWLHHLSSRTARPLASSHVPSGLCDTPCTDRIVKNHGGTQLTAFATLAGMPRYPISVVVQGHSGYPAATAWDLSSI